MRHRDPMSNAITYAKVSVDPMIRYAVSAPQRSLPLKNHYGH